MLWIRLTFFSIITCLSLIIGSTSWLNFINGICLRELSYSLFYNLDKINWTGDSYLADNEPERTLSFGIYLADTEPERTLSFGRVSVEKSALNIS